MPVLLAAVAYGYASQGPNSYRTEYRHQVDTALAETRPGAVVTEADLDHLPEHVAGYVRGSGAVGRPRVTNFDARVHGRIRGGATKPWMSFTGKQVNTYGPEPSRLLFMDVTMFGLPVDVLHTYLGRIHGPTPDPPQLRAGPHTLTGNPGPAAPSPPGSCRWNRTFDSAVRSFLTDAGGPVSPVRDDEAGSG